MNLVIYVDDIIVTESNSDGIDKVKEHLKTQIVTKDMSRSRYFLEIEVTHIKHRVVLFQRKYALDLLQETRLLCCKTVHILTNTDTDL